MSTGRPVHNSQHVGRFVSKYIDAPADPLYPFGYGLSYDQIKYSDLKLDKEKLSRNEELNVSIKLTNDSNWDCKETVQLYFHDKVASLVQPVKRLLDFQKVEVPKNSSKEVTFMIKPQQLGFFDNHGQYVLENGKFDIFVGRNSRDCLQKEFLLD
ncbi:fibronectin type III-like domain-contianing protein [Lactobacillus amylovorus]|nr:fibronectin type III-like domain-contianing protein [Lactobacillus amylovorus]